MRSKLYLSNVAFPQVGTKWKDGIVSIQINVTNRCPCKCVMCNKYKWPQVELSAENLREILAAYSTIDSVVVSGGEPLMYDYLPVFKDPKYDHIALGMITCGFGKHASNAELLKRFQWIRTSLDGFEATHNAIRQREIFSYALAFASKVKSMGIDSRIQYTIQESNVQEFVPFLKYIIEVFGIDVYGFFAHDINELSSDQQLALKMDLFRLSLQDEAYRQKSNILELLWQLSTEPHRSKICIIPKIHRVIDADGSVWPCCMLMADNLDYDKRDMKYSNWINIASVVAKRPEICKTCDNSFSRYQRINEEFDLMRDARERKIFL